MTRAGWTILILGAMVLFCGACGEKGGSTTATTPKTLALTVLRLKGDVQMSRRGSEDLVPLGKDMRLVAGDAIRTGAASWASFRLPDGGVVQVSASSRMTVKELLAAEDNGAGVVGSTLELIEGIGLFQAEGKSLRVETRNAVTGVIGTMFGVEAGPDATRLVVKKHRVWIAPAADGADEGTTAPPTGASVRTVPEAHQSKVLGSNAPTEPEAVNLIMPSDDDRLAKELVAFESYVNTAIRGMSQEGVTEKSLDRSIDLDGKTK